MFENKRKNAKYEITWSYSNININYGAYGRNMILYGEYIRVEGISC